MCTNEACSNESFTNNSAYQKTEQVKRKNR